MNSAPSHPLATSHIQRACTRSPSAAVVSAHSSRHVTWSAITTRELLGPLVRDQRLDNIGQVAGEDLLQPVDREADAMIGETVLLVVVGADLLAAAAGADLRSALG